MFEKITELGASQYLHFTKYYKGDEGNSVEMGRECSTQ
jgi:hypothetical protein